MTIHTLEPTGATLHGHFSRDLAPALTVDSGDVVRCQTLDSGWGLVAQDDPFARPAKFPARDPRRDPGHALIGPIAVRGARAGMTLEVRVTALRPGRWGWSGAGGYPSPLNTRLGVGEPPECVFRWAIDPDAGVATNQHGRQLRIRPFLGMIGMPPDAPGAHSTFPPRFCGGNLDCTALVAGSRLFLPIPVDGALLSVGDGHAVQGDGEVGGVALECPMEHVELELHLHPDLALTMPRAESPAGWVAIGVHEELGEAAALALDGMLDLLGVLHGVDRREALALAGLVVDVRVTQLVNGVRGVHALLPAAALVGHTQ